MNPTVDHRRDPRHDRRGGRRQDRVYGLTRRQLSVVEKLWAGKSYKEIAWELGISYGSVKTHMHEAAKALGLSRMVAMVLWYERTVAPSVRRDTIPA